MCRPNFFHINVAHMDEPRANVHECRRNNMTLDLKFHDGLFQSDQVQTENPVK